MSSRAIPKVCLAINTPLGTPIYHVPPHPSQALRMLVKMMNIHSTAITKAILEQLHSNVIDVSKLWATFLSTRRGGKECIVFHTSLSLPLGSLGSHPDAQDHWAGRDPGTGARGTHI